jgi:hypothetical protein
MDRTVFDLDAARRGWAWTNFFARAILHIISPFILIWCVNTLFGTQIPFAFKTWLSGFLLMLIIKLTVGSGNRPFPVQSYYGDHYDDDEDEEPEETMTKEETFQRLKSYSEARKEMSQGKDCNKKQGGEPMPTKKG